MTLPPNEQIFPWPTLQAMVGGMSALDLPRLNLRTLDGAAGFLERYGYDWSEESDRAAVQAIRADAITFLEEELLDELGLEVPPRLLAEADVRRLLLTASNGSGDAQRWACALLRVMHAFAHARSAFEEWFGDVIREQVLDRFAPSLSDADGTLWLGEGDEAIQLHTFSIKHRKSIHSVVMKLLHKVENVASDIFDRIGVRIVTKNRFDALLVVRFLRRSHIVALANIKASRSRNTLVDLDWLKHTLDEMDALVDADRLAAADRIDWLRQKCVQSPYPQGAGNNPHSSSDYRALQFTCRQLIRVPGDRLGRPGHTLRFFFPYEVQVLDRESYEATRSGRASHRDYKQRQRRTVCRRILGDDLFPQLVPDASLE